MSTTFGTILILVDNPSFHREKPYEISLVGKTMSEWVKNALGGAPSTVVAGLKDDVIARVKPMVDTALPYTVVLYSDTPLMTRSTVMEAVRTIERRGDQVLRLTRGWVFETEYLMSLSALPAVPRRYMTEEEDFMMCADCTSLALVTEIMRQRIHRYHMQNGVHIVDPSSTYIDGDVLIGSHVTIYPGNHLRGRTVIGNGVTLEAGNVVTDCVIDDGAVLTSSNLTGSYIGKSTTVGPFAYVRPGCNVGEGCRIGDYVELKKVTIGDRSKISHLTYLGDCTLGHSCNVGCGVITANYDGKSKYRTEIGNHVFIGSNATLIAPIRLADGSFVAAGSTLTEDVEKDGLAIARARQITKPERTLW